MPREKPGYKERAEKEEQPVFLERVLVREKSALSDRAEETEKSYIVIES